MMKEKLLSLFALMSLGLSPLALAENKLCPIMIEDETDEEEVVEFEGKKVLFCCGTCVKLWNQSPKYYIKVMGELLPQFKGMEKELGLDEIKVLPQKFCPVYPDRIVTPESPSVDVQGEKVYLFSKAAVRRWSRKPEDSLKKALAAGLLPQIEGNAKVAGKTNEVSK
ncbi:MAG: hypothetical protein CMN04_12045 [Roseibacillus sp.]|nr:hypothetical protein [Roseibacillus sp.]|tara:strand:+ start:1126 stop:1626 length:501 start_codon:yes stop_codon:yes gene_type:complete